MQKAVFLDRDGVINIEKNYLYKIEDFEFIDGVFDGLKYLQDKGYLLFIVTNQSGIARSYYTKEDFELLTSWMLKEFEKNNIKISQVEYCPHRPEDNCICRKPRTLLIENILENYKIDLDESWFIGDKKSDILCAINAEIKNSVQVKSGHKFDEEESLASFICDSLKYIHKIII